MSLHKTRSELFAIVSPVPSFLTGAASVLDLGGTLTHFRLYETGGIPAAWQAVGDALRAAIATTEEHLSEADIHGEESSPADDPTAPATDAIR